MDRSRLLRHFALVGFLAALTPLMTPPSTASCAGAQRQRAIPVCPRLFSSYPSYVVTPGCEHSDCGIHASSITDDLIGKAWMFGDGNPVVGLGIDNGSFPALGGWMYVYPGYPAFVSSTWAADAGIDGCVDFAADSQRCMGMLLSDLAPDTGGGSFTLVTDEPDQLGNYDLSQRGDILLGPIPRPVLLSVVRAGLCAGTSDVCTSPGGCEPHSTCLRNDTVAATLGLPPAEELEGLYLDSECAAPGDWVTGYRIYQREVPRDSPIPTSGDRSEWVAVAEESADGTPIFVLFDCPRQDTLEPFDVFLAATLLFESGFESEYLSLPSTRMPCGPTLADPDPLSPRKPRGRERPRNRER